MQSSAYGSSPRFPLTCCFIGFPQVYRVRLHDEQSSGDRKGAAALRAAALAIY
jgi:hypothetical protein